MNSMSLTYEQWALARLTFWRKHIEKALVSCRCPVDFEYIVHQVMNKKLLLFDNGGAFSIINVCSYDEQLIYLHIFIAGGKQEDIYRLEEECVAPFGRKIGAKHMSLMGRKGFTRRLYTRGWFSPGVYMEKDL